MPSSIVPSRRSRSSRSQLAAIALRSASRMVDALEPRRLLAAPALVSIDRFNSASGAGGGSEEHDISSDGRYVTFISNATNLTTIPTGGNPQLYRRDLTTNTTEMLSRTSGGAAANFAVLEFKVTPSGRYTIFKTGSTNLAPFADTSSGLDWYWRDNQTGTIKLVSVRPNGFAANAPDGIEGANLSDDGRWVVFATANADLYSVPGTIELQPEGSTTQYHVLRFDSSVASGNPIRAVTTKFNSQSFFADTSVNVGFNNGVDPRVSNDGRYVFYTTINATDLVGGGDNSSSGEDVMVRDMNGTPARYISTTNGGTQSGNGTSIKFISSADGRYVAFNTNADDLAANDNNGTTDVMLYDRVGNVMRRVSSAADAVTNLATGPSSNEESNLTDMSPDGRYVAYASLSTDLRNRTDTNFDYDAFLYARDSNTNLIISAMLTPDGNGNIAGGGVDPHVSDDGKTVTWVSETPAGRFVSGVTDTNGAFDAFARRLNVSGQADTNYLLSESRVPGRTGNFGVFSDRVRVAGNGSRASFVGQATDHVLNDTNNQVDVFATTLPAIASPLNTPTGFAVTPVSQSQLNLSWTDNNTTETGYRIERSIFSNFSSFLTFNAAANATSFSATGLSANTTYYFRLYAVNGSASSSPATANGKTLAAGTAPTAPSNLRTTATTASGFSLAWNDNSSNETGFRVERATNSTFTTGLSTTTVGANVTTLSVTGLTANTTYFFRVFALNGALVSTASNTLTAKTNPAVPTAPSNLRTTAITTTGINLAWNDNSTNETGFRVERATNNTFTTGLTTTTTAANATTLNVTGLAANTTYFFRVFALNGASTSAASNVLTAKTLATTTSPFSLVSGKLTVTGTSGNDVITINKSGSSWVAKLNSTTSPLFSGVTSIVINAGAGNDLVTIGAGITSTTANGDGGDDTLVGGSAADSLNGGTGNDVLIGNGGVDRLDGGDNDDLLLAAFDGANDVLIGGAGNDKAQADTGDTKSLIETIL